MTEPGGCRMSPPIAVLVVALVVVVRGNAQDTCLINQELLEVEPNADITIGAVLPIHEPGEGIYGCGAPSAGGIEIFESMRWAVRVLNQDSGVINGKSITQSFIPGVKIGLKVYDNCGHDQLAVRQMTDLVPVLKTGSAMCWSDQNNSSLVLGLMDLSGSIFKPRVAESLRKYFIPAVPLTENASIGPDHVAKVITEIVHDMEWKRVAVIHVDDEYSVHIVKLLGQVALSGRLCFAAIESIPGVKSSSPELRSYQRALNLMTTKLPENMGVLVIGQGEPIRRLLQVMAEIPETVIRLQWLFSWVPDPAAIGVLGDVLNSKRIFSLGPYPSKIASLEDHWTKLQDLAVGIRADDRWFLEYVMARKHCRVPGMPPGDQEDLPLCANLALREMPADVLWRTSRSLTPLHAIFTFAHALQRAWQEHCQGIIGLCSELRQLSRRDFVSQYLEPLEFEHKPDDRSPPEMSGRKSQSSQAGEIEGLRLSLTQYNYDRSLGVGFRQVIFYDSDKAQVMDPTFQYLPSKCPHDGCGSCIKVRESREGSGIKLSPGVHTIGSPRDYFLPLMLPLHLPGNSPLECNSMINHFAVQELEAALWMVDKVNSDSEFLPGVKLGIVAMDTCSSSIKTTEQLSAFLQEKSAIGAPSIDLEDAVAFISSASAEESVAAASLLSPLNISMIAARDMTVGKQIKLGFQHYNFQVATPLEVRIKAAMEMLHYLGWTFLSVLYSNGSSNMKMLDVFRKVAKESDVCLGFVHAVDPKASDDDFDTLLTQLKQMSERGAKAVALLTDEPSTNSLLNAIRQTRNTGFIKKGDFVWLLLRDWADNPSFLKEYEDEMEGALLFRAQHSIIRDFETYFRRLQPDSNDRNPWFAELWHHMSACTGSACPMMPSNGRSVPLVWTPAVINTMQAVLVVSSAFARLRNEVCRSERGVCSRLLIQPELRNIISRYIQYIASMKPDIEGEMFTFSMDGYGTRPIEVANLRRAPGNAHAYQKVAVYSSHRLTNTAPMVSYGANNEEMPLDHVTSECTSSCSMCKQRVPDFLVLDSSDQLYLAATFGVHKQAENPLHCSQMTDPSGMQNMEAFLWALDELNRNPQLLPGVKLGSIIFDTCGSPQRASRDVPSFFSRRLRTEGSEEELPIASRVVSFVASQGVNVVQPVIDLMMSLRIPTVAPQVTSSSLNDMNSYPYLMRLSLPNNILAQGLVKLLKHFRWSFVSVVYSKDRWYNEDVFRIFQQKAESADIKFALVEAVPMQSTNWDVTMDTVINRLKIKQQEGARAVVVLLNSEQLSHLLATSKRLHEAGQLKVGDLVWMVHDNREIFHQFTEQSLGALSLMTTSGIVPNFQKYFQSLSLRNNTRNPWFREYWEQVFNCRGAACYNGLVSDLRSVTFMQDHNVPSTVNSVLALAHALESTRRSLCPGQARGLCAAMLNHPNLGELTLESMRQANFIGADGKPVTFTKENYLISGFDIANFRQVGSNAFAFVGVGKYSEVDGLTMNMTKVRGYNQEGHEISLADVISQCNHSDACPRGMSYRSSPSVMQIVPSHEFTIGSLMAVHQKGDSLFTCGALDKDVMFQNLVAFAYALDKVNNNRSVLPELMLGAIVFDYCDSKQRAEEKLFHYFSENGMNKQMETKIKPKSLIAMISYDIDVAEEVSPILEANTIPQIANPSASDVSKVSSEAVLTFKPVPSAISQVDALVAILKQYDWKYVSLIYTDNKYGIETKNEFLKKAREEEICLSEMLEINVQSSQDGLTDQLQNLMDPLVHVVVVLVDNIHLMRAIFMASKELSLLDRYVWVGTEGLADLSQVASTIGGIPVNIFAVKLETYFDQDFPRFFSGLTLGKHEPIPTPWFEEFWQHHFRCQLPSSLMVQRQYPTVCSGKERIREDLVGQNDFIYLTIRSVENVAQALHNFLRKQCIPGDAAMTIEDCGFESRKMFSREVGSVVMGEECEGKCEKSSTPIGYQILQLRNTSRDTHAYVQVGLWKDNKLSLSSANVAFVGGIAPQSLCYGDCRKCSQQLQGQPIKDLPAHQPLFQNFRTVWGIVATALSILGIVLVIICVLYFLMAFPVTVGTTVLGYMILFGLLVLYAVNFAFIFPPTECTCGVRRFVMGLAYAIVFSGMLVKVMNTWRLMGYNGNRMMHDGTRLSSPAGLLVVAVGLVIVQIVLTAAWLILMPPKLGIYEALWRCAPPDVFEEELIISLIYVMLLLAGTILFSILTWHCQDNNGESRWILACCLFVGIAWIAWTVLSTLLPLRFRDLTIVAANLVCASLVMLCLYMRKVYLYSKLTRQARDREMKAKLQPVQYQTPVYGTLHKNAPLGPVLYGSQASLNNRKIFSSPARNSVEGGGDEDTHSGSSGSVQVQATDLYPLEMYDGGCQFQPSNSIYSSKGMVILDDGPTFVR